MLIRDVAGVAGKKMHEKVLSCNPKRKRKKNIAMAIKINSLRS